MQMTWKTRSNRLF